MSKSKYYNFPFDPWDIIESPKDKEPTTKVHMLYMLNRTLQMLKYNGLPDTIPEKMLALMLQSNGNVCITTDDEGNLRAFTGGLGGERDIYYRPTQYIIANPRLKQSKVVNIGEDGVVVRNDPMLIGLLPLCMRYARALTENEVSLYIACINARIPSVLTADNDNSAAGAKKYIADILKGELGIIADKSLLEGIKSLPFASSTASNILKSLIEHEQYLRGSWYNELGLNALYNMKREAINESEAGMNMDALLPLIDGMLEVQQVDFEKVNQMFGTHITVEKNSAWSDVQKSADDIINEEIEDQRNANI